MKKTLICLLTFAALLVCAWNPPKEYENAYLYGAKAKLTFRVTDSQGIPVTNVDVRVVFMLPQGKYTMSNEKTDTNGLLVVEGKTSGKVNFQFTKEGHYETRYSRSFLGSERDRVYVKEGKMQPWNPTIEITLKEKRNPIPMYAKSTTVFLSKKNEPFGYDFKMGDLVEPHGKGKEVDVTFMYSSDFAGAKEHRYTNQIVVASVNPNEGFINFPNDNSPFRSVYEAPVTGYWTPIELYRKSQNQATLEEVQFDGSYYFVFRSRVKLDDDGNIISAHYGKVTGLDYGEAPSDKGEGRVEITFYFNPTPNDRNLEYDPNENLFDKKKFRGMQP